MSTSTETIYVRGVRVARFLEAIDAFMRVNGLTRVSEAGTGSRRTVTQHLVLRRDGKWLILADTLPNSYEAWGKHLSRFLRRSVLTIFTWDGEAAVLAQRWKDGKVRAELDLLRQAFRDADGRPRAPAKVLWPWLDPLTRDATLRDGVPLRDPSGEGTGDPDLDALLDTFDDVPDETASVGDHIYVPIGTSVLSLAAPIGLRRPFLDRHDLDPDDRDLAFQPIR